VLQPMKSLWVLISPNCVFDASLVPETCLEFSPLPVCVSGFDSAS
jgi:hypothetical protein